MNVVFSCLTAFDRLGHGEMNDEVCGAFEKLFPNVSYLSFGLAVTNEHNVSESAAKPLVIGRWTKHFTIENKKAIFIKYGSFGSFLFSIYRIYVGLSYYAKLYSVVNRDDILVDLEFEPIQSFIFHTFCKRVPFKHHVCVIHSFPNGHEKGFKRLYKQLSLLILRMYAKKYSVIGVMTDSDLNKAKSYGFNEDQILLVGWGLRENRPKFNSHDNFFQKPITRFLMAGVLRKDKQIEKVIGFFKNIKDPEIKLLIAGAPIDVDPNELQKIIDEYGMSDSIEVEPRYFNDEEFSLLFDESDIIVLSHNSSFHSMSGPLFTALERRKPILCFSSNYISKLVMLCNAGMVLENADDMDCSIIKNEVKALKGRRYDIPNGFPFSWIAIVKRLASKIEVDTL